MDKWLIGSTAKANELAQSTATATCPGSTAFVAGCKYKLTERSDGRWNIVTSAGAVTSRATRAAAAAHVQHLLANPPRNQQPALSTRRSSRQSEALADTALARSQLPPKKKQKPRWGRGNKRQETDAMDSATDAVLDYLAANPVVAKKTKLGTLAKKCASQAKNLAEDHRQLKIKYDKARLLLSVELGYDPGPLRRSEVAELVGLGYDDLKGSTIRRHKLDVLSTIRLHAGDDLFAQRQLAEAVLTSLSVQKQTVSEEEELFRELEGLVMDGIRDFFQIQSDRRPNDGKKKGRQPHSDKIARESVQAAIVNKIPAGKVAAVARMLETNRDQLREAQGKFEGYKGGDLETIYQAEATSCNAYPEKYVEQVKKMWKAGTRKSQNKRDEVRNPAKKSDKKLYRIRLLEQSIPHLCNWMVITGRAELDDPEFHVSIKTMMKHMPHEVRKPNRRTALCRYHMEHAHFTEVGRKWSASTTKEAFEMQLQVVH